jgi:uncharacterized alpha-E superfamily protein
MNRYVERAENVARFINVNYNLSLGNSEALYSQWAPLVYITGDQEEFLERYENPTREHVLQFLAFDEQNPNSILRCLQVARENARTIREVITSAMWEEINKFYYLVVAASRQHATLEQPYAFCSEVRRAGHLLAGATDSTMSQGEPYSFGRMGRFIERADKTSRIVDVQYFLLLPKAHELGGNLDTVRWAALLKSASALEMYRRKHGRIVPALVAEYLLLDREFPRSVHFCLAKAHTALRRITGSQVDTFSNLTEQRMGRLRTELDFVTIRDVVQRGMHEFIDDFQVQLNALGEAIHDDFFSLNTHAEAEQTQWQSM